MNKYQELYWDRLGTTWFSVENNIGEFGDSDNTDFGFNLY